MSALILVSLNLRAIVTSIAAVLFEIQEATAMSDSLAGMLTSLPCFIFGAVGLLTPVLSRRLGIIPLLCISMGILTLGLSMRVFVTQAPAFLWWTALGLSGVAIANVLLPPYIRTYFPQRSITLMSTYTIMLGIGTVVSAFLAAPLARAFSWQMSIGVWAWLALLAFGVVLVLWFSQARAPQLQPAPPQHSAPSGSFPIRHLLHAPKARWLVCFFTVQSFNAYAQMGWLVQIIRDQGFTATTAGLMLGVMQLVIIPGGFLAPYILHRTAHPSRVITGLALIIIPAYMGILWLPQAMWIWVLLITASNLCFPIALCLIGTSARTAETTQSLSAAAQGIGYIFAGIGPLAVGLLLSISHNWTAPLLFLTCSIPLLAYAGYKVAQPGFIEDSLPQYPDSPTK